MFVWEERGRTSQRRRIHYRDDVPAAILSAKRMRAEAAGSVTLASEISMIRTVFVVDTGI
jgi:hypothetical protein